MKKKIVLGLFLVALSVGVISVSAYSFNTFYGGVTGLPGNGTTWGEYSPRGKNVYVTAVGKSTKTVNANSGGTARASVSRAFSGNRSYWGLR